MQIAGQIFTGVMDTDSDPRVVSPEDFTYALAIQNGYGEQPGALVFEKGNSSYTLGLPSGTNTVIGTAEDKQNAALFIFVQNNLGSDRIFRWDLAANEHTTVAQGPALGFDVGLRIVHAKIVDGRLLYWTDAQEDGGTIAGSPQRKININKGDVFKYLIEYEIYAGKPGEGQFANLNEYRFSLVDWAGNETEVNTYTADGMNLDTPDAGLSWLKTQLEGDYDGIAIDDCDGCKLKVSLPNDTPGARLQLTADAGDVILVPVNTYPITLEEHHIDLLKQPPHCAPTANYSFDPDVPTNNVKNMCAQFRVRYIYDDGERSAWGPVSNVALNTGATGEPISVLNTIKVDFTDPRLSDPSWLCIVRAVEVAFRDGNENNWHLIERYDACELGVTSQYINFYNDKIYSVLPSDDTSTPSELQVLKPFDFLPARSVALDVGADRDGNSLLFLGGNQENEDNPDCIEFTATPVEHEDECLVDIVGTVRILNDSNFPSPGALGVPSFDAYPLQGFVVYLAGTGYFAISNNPEDESGDGSFRISGVPKSKKYILRVASFRCSFTNDLGPRYNLANGLEWQRTSAPCIEVAGGIAAGDGQYERTIDLSAFTGTEFDLDAEVGYGPVDVANQHYKYRVTAAPPAANSCNLYEYHVLDNDALNDDVNDRIAAFGCERQKVVGNARSTGIGSDATLVTDHNGYCWDRRYHPSGVAIISGTIPVNENTYHPAFANREMYNGGFKELYDDTLTVVANTNSTTVSQQYIIINEASTFSALRKKLRTRAIDGGSGATIPNVIFTLQRGRYTQTGIDGVAIIPFFIPFATAPDRDDDSLIALYLDDVCHEGYADPDIVLVDAEDPISDPFEVPDFEFLLSAIAPNKGRFFKGGGEYSFGILYEDRGNRTPGAIFGAKVHFPAHTDGLTKWQMAWEINHVPPIWATHYRIVRLLNGTHNVYVQWKVPEVRYVRIPSQLEAPVDTTFDSGDFTHILLKLFTPTVADPDTVFFFQQDGQQGYVPRVGDRARLILTDTGLPVNTSETTYEADIVGTFADGDDIFAIVPAVFGAIEIKNGFLIEYYTPVTGQAEIYYEGGEDCYEIGFPGTGPRYHKGQTQDQDVGTLPATGIFTGGDTYWRRQKFTETGVYETEHQTPHRYIDSRCEDIGRPFALSTDVQEEYYYNRIRVSGIFIPNSAANGLSSFSANEYKDINRQWGPIKFLGFVNNVLLAICKFKVQPIYVGKGELLYLSGGSNVGRSDQIMEIADESTSDYGTHDPASVVIEGGSCYFFDRFQGAVCRYAQNGVVPITTKMVKYFRDAGKFLMSNRGEAIAGYDRVHQQYLLTITGLTGGDVTLAYDEVKGGWPCYMPYVPECYGRVGTELFTFKRYTPPTGPVVNMWRHFQNSLYTNYYAVQYKPIVSFVANQTPALTKLFKSIRINSTKKWESPAIILPGNTDYSAGMQSLLKENHFFSYEGQWRADFLRDILDTDQKFAGLTSPDKENNALLRGRDLRGEYALITIRAVDGSLQMILTRADVYFIPSMRSHG